MLCCNAGQISESPVRKRSMIPAMGIPYDIARTVYGAHSELDVGGSSLLFRSSRFLERLACFGSRLPTLSQVVPRPSDRSQSCRSRTFLRGPAMSTSELGSPMH